MGWPHLSGAGSPRCRRTAGGRWQPGRGLDGMGAAGLRERDSVGAYLVRAGLALLAWLVPWRAVAALARACRPPRGAGLSSLAATWRCDRLMLLPAGLILIWFWQAALCIRTE
jgi:hypothetical protein